MKMMTMIIEHRLTVILAHARMFARLEPHACVCACLSCPYFDLSSMVEVRSEPPPAKRRRLKLSLSRCRPPSALPQPDDETTEDGALSPPAEAAVGSEGEEEAYFSANFKTVCGAVLAEDCAERHVFTDSDRDTVERFMTLPGTTLHHCPVRYFDVCL